VVVGCGHETHSFQMLALKMPELTGVTRDMDDWRSPLSVRTDEHLRISSLLRSIERYWKFSLFEVSLVHGIFKTVSKFELKPVP
jgi:hypothetical protein